jgi:cellobiose-specific phosphotransferase system component IIC
VLSLIIGPDIVVVLLALVFIFSLFALSVYAIIDIASHSRVDFYRAGYSKTAWIVVICVCTLFWGFGVFNAAYYLIAVRPKVRRVEKR